MHPAKKNLYLYIWRYIEFLINCLFLLKIKATALCDNIPRCAGRQRCETSLQTRRTSPSWVYVGQAIRQTVIPRDPLEATMEIDIK